MGRGTSGQCEGFLIAFTLLLLFLAKPKSSSKSDHKIVQDHTSDFSLQATQNLCSRKTTHVSIFDTIIGLKFSL